MRYASMTERLAGDGPDGWGTLFEAWQARQRGEDVIILAIGDPDFPTPEPIVDAAVDALRAGDTHYSEIVGRPALRELVAARFSAKTGREWGPEHVMPFAGTQNALFAASLCLLEADDEVIAFDPMYLTYDATLRAGGATLTRLALDADNGFRIDADLLAARITPATRAVVLNTPNNPTGAVASVDELEGVAELARRHDLWVIADEVYSELVFEGSHTSMAALDGMADRTVTVSSLSKSHAMTGWRIGWAVAPPRLIEHFNDLGMAMAYGLPGFIQAAAAEALATQDAAVDEMRAIYRRRRDLSAEALAGIDGVDVLVPQAGMYLMVDVRSLPASDDGFAWDLFRATGVSVVDAGGFGPASDGWLRLSFTESDENLVEGCRRLRDYIAGLR
ncbi:MAG: aminotransferase class I/II-fold pyridoxal phosphate-dependent enzyme [Actinomycetota bacterium]